MKKILLLTLIIITILFSACSQSKQEVVIHTDQTQDNNDQTINENIVEFTIDSFNYGYSIEEIRVKKGDKVKITLTNSNGFHDFVIDEFNIASKRINQGETTTIEFVADKTGEFFFYCSVGSHREAGMEGKFIVEE